MRTTLTAIAFLISAGSALAGQALSECPATKEIFEELKTGMFISRVESIFGCKGILVRETEMFGVKTASYYWTGTDYMQTINIMTQDRRVIMKSQNGIY